MQSILDAINEWIKEILIGAINGNLSTMFGDVNEKVGTIAAEVGKTPQGWNANIFSMIQTLADTRNDLSWDSHSHTLSFSVGISETQQLSVVLEIFYPQKKSSSAYQILQWNTELTGFWQPDNHQNVFKGE